MANSTRNPQTIPAQKPGPFITYFVWLGLTLAVFGGALWLLWSVTQ